MSNQAEETEVVEDVAEEQEQVEQVEQEEAQAEAEQDEATETSEADEVVVTIGDASPASEDSESTEGLPEWVKTLRHEHREKARELRKLRAELAQRQDSPAQAVQVGPKPTLEAADYDAEKFEAQLTAWHDRKRAADEQERQKREAEEANQKAWNAKLETYGAQKSALKVSDYEDAEAQALDVLSVTQQGVILQGAENPAVVVYALGKNPAKAKELSSITDPVKFAFAVAKLETQMKVTPRKVAPMPESRVSGAGRVPVSGDAKLKQLEEKADRTGDRTELVNYKRSLKQKAVS